MLLRLLLLTAFFNMSVVLAQDPDTYESSIANWCRGRLDILRQAKQDALVHYSNGAVENSIESLHRGLVDAADRTPENSRGSLTSKAINRGLLILEKLTTIEDSSPNVLRTLNNYLFEYYTFIENVARRLDIPYYPYYNSSPYSASPYGYQSSGPQSSHQLIEQRFIRFAKEQMRLVLKKFADAGSVPHGGRVVPVGTPYFYLVSLQLMTDFMWRDLSESIYAYSYACQIASSQNLSNRLKQYLAGEGGYVSVQDAISRSYHDAKSILGFQCNSPIPPRQDGDWGNNRYYTVVRIPTGVFRLDRNEKKTIYLGRPGHVKKLIIWARGNRMEAMFDLVFYDRQEGRDIKGTIHVPKPDPMYYVTVEEFTDTISFESRWGRAIIDRIDVVYDTDPNW